jgi:hypothetical protein
MFANPCSDYRGLADGALAFYRCERTTHEEQRNLQRLAEINGLGGLFVATEDPPRPGSVVDLHVYCCEDCNMTSPLYARGVVRWRRLWGRQKGMGVELLELDGMGERCLECWLTATPVMTAPRPRRLLQATA